MDIYKRSHPFPHLAFAGALPFERVLLAPPDDPPPDPPAPPAPKMIAQDEVNKIVAREKATLEKQLKAANEGAAKTTELEKQLADLRAEMELAGKSAEEKTRIQAEQAAKKMQSDREAFEKRATEAEAKAKASDTQVTEIRKRYAATAALTEAKALPKMIKHAVPAFLAAAEIDLDEHGEIAAVRYGGIAQKNIVDAAKAFLKDEDGFAAIAAGGGSGGRAPNGGGPAGTKLDDMTPTELATLALQKRKAQGKHGMGDYAPPSAAGDENTE